jgi:DNA uptake protein ComE-like DNA-binding protein
MFIRLAKTFALLGIAASAMGCAYDTSSTEPGESTKGASQDVVITQDEVKIVLAFLNDPATDFTTLDERVGLDVRAAQNLMDHRNGADGVYPSADDDRFDTLAEVDAIGFVGNVALDKLRVYAIEHAPLPPEYVEGVQFTSEQATAVVWGVNHATLGELDVEIGLSSQAAQNLIASGPYTSVSAMGAVAYVGPSALNALKNHAVIWAARMNGGNQTSQAGVYDSVTFDAPTAEIALSIAQTASFEQLTIDGGLPSAGAHAIVDNRPYVTLAEVSGAYGVGHATMDALHSYATSGLFSTGAAGQD